MNKVEIDVIDEESGMLEVKLGGLTDKEWNEALEKVKLEVAKMYKCFHGREKNREQNREQAMRNWKGRP